MAGLDRNSIEAKSSSAYYSASASVTPIVSAACVGRAPGPSQSRSRPRVSLAAVAAFAWTSQIFAARVSLVALAVRWALTVAQASLVASAAALASLAVLYRDSVATLVAGSGLWLDLAW